MEQLVYTSVAAKNVDAGDLFQIIRQASERNVARELTGMLALAHGRFFQAIEGPKHQIDRLMASLERDPRHHLIKVLLRRPITARQFDGWRMKRVILRDIPGAEEAFGKILSRKQDAKAILEEFDRYLQQTQAA